jgi:hypothetical protein
MRYTAILALTASLVLLGCKNLQPGASSAAPAQPAASQSSTPAQGAPGADASNTTPTPQQPKTAATAQPESKPAQPPVKELSKSAAQTTKGSASPAPQPPKAANGNSMSPKAPPPSPAKSAARVAEPAGPPPAPALDLNSLKERLKDTRAIGVFTKLSLKNQVDDLLGQLRAFHAKKAATSLAELHQRYDLLLLKVLSLLQDGDPSLAAAISQSRDSIWSILSDPQQFAKL